VSTSQFVCGHAGCGLPVHGGRAWQHSLGGGTGAIPARKKHKPVPVPRTEYDRLSAMDTPIAECRALAAKFRQLDHEINGGPAS
jgi:hypothetical protein